MELTEMRPQSSQAPTPRESTRSSLELEEKEDVFTHNQSNGHTNDATKANGNGASHDANKNSLTKSTSSFLKQPGSLPTLNDYIEYIELLHSPSAWSDAPRVSIAYENLSYNLPLPVDEAQNPSVGKAFLDMFRMKQKINLPVYNKLTGFIPSGRMTLVLAPPGAGKSQFLKTLAGHMLNNKNVEGELLYDGLSPQEQLRAGIYTQKLCALVAQGDVHMANLTVRETLEFAFQNSVLELTKSLFPDKVLDKKLLEYHKQKVQLLLSVLGMHECSETIAGNDMIRGVSGGQKKRLTIGEMMVTNARVLLLDEPTTGLDAAVARDIMMVLRRWCQVSGGTVIAALLQATPECYQLYDDVILMREGEILYHGPREEVEQFIEQSWGLIRPEDQDEADYIIEVLSNPAHQYVKQQARFNNHKEFARRYPLTFSPLSKTELDTQITAARGNGVNGVARHDTTEQNRLNVTSSSSSTKDQQPAVRRSQDGVVVFHLPSEDDASLKSTDVDDRIVDVSKGSAPAAMSMNQELIVSDPSDPLDRVPLVARDPRKWPITNELLLAQYKKSSYYSYQVQKVQELQKQRQEKVQHLDKLKLDRSPYTLAQYGRLYTRGFVESTKSSLRRQFTLLSRDKQTVPPRAFTAIFQSLIFGSLFYQLSDSNFYAKLGIILFSIMFFCMGNFTELPATFEGRNAVYKQVDAGMYPTVSYMIAITIASFPVLILEASLFVPILYFMIGLATDAGRFFFFYLCMLLSNLMFSTLFRAICFAVVSIDEAQQVAMPIMNIGMVYSGFLILKPSIKDWQIEFYWLSPFSWIVRSLGINEFSASKYDGYTSGTQTRVGDGYLNTFGIQTDFAYKWSGVGFVFFTCLLFIYLASRWLKNTRFDLLQGTKRIKNQDGENEVKEYISLSNSNGNGLSAVNVTPDLTKMTRQISMSSNMGNKPQGRSTVLPFQPASFSFSHIHYTITVKNTDPAKKGPKTYQKKLLTDVSGYVVPGQLVALMGSSGAGKTTLLDVIAGRKTAGVIEGDIRVNGVLKSENEEMFRRMSGYCEQRDMHMPLATVRESLMFSASLRLPNTVSETDRIAFVDEILDILELTPLADRIVGNEKYAGLSPGQLKLLTIGVELAANPSILFLDEPTSGLDSRAAVVVMRVVKKIAQTGRSVLCTIHQPSEDVFFYFDSMLLLRTGGRTVFFGDLGEDAVNLVNYFESIPNERGELPKKPSNMNPASWMLDVIGAGLSGALVRAAAAKAALNGGAGEGKEKPFDYADIFEAHPLYQKGMAELSSVVSRKAELEGHTKTIEAKDYVIPLSRQVRCVVERGFTSYWRDSQMNFGRLMMLIVISLIFGIVYVQLDGKDYASLTSKQSAVFSIAGFIAMLSAQTTLPVIFAERSVHYRELAARAYPSWIYSTTIGLCEIPYVLVSSLFGIVIFYWMVGYENDAALFFQFWFAISVLVLIESSFGQLAAALFPNFVVAIQLAGALNTLFFLFGGLFIRPADIPQGWKWFYYMNPIPKTIVAIVLPQFQCHLPNPYDYQISACPKIFDGKEHVTIHKFIHDQWDFGYDNAFAINIGWLILTYFVFRIGIWFSLRYINHLTR